MATCPNWSNPQTIQTMNGIMTNLGQDPFTTNEVELLKTNKEEFKRLVSDDRLKATYAAYNEYYKNDGNVVNYQLKAVNILLSDKAKQVFAKGNKSNWSLDKILTELQVPKDQKVLLLGLGINNREELALDFANQYSYTVEINTAKENAKTFNKIQGYDAENVDINSLRIEESDWGGSYIIVDKNGKHLTPLEYTKEEAEEIIAGIGNVNTQYYSNLSAPGDSGKNKYKGNPDWEYQELEFKTPLITLSSKGHAQFATDKGIGWARIWYNKKTGVVEIQEIQSDLFQKGRDEKFLISNLEYTLDDNPYYKGDLLKSNQFLQLLNKDSNWVTFFIKSIIQDSAKKGYEKVLFPKGETAAKIEGHETIAEEIARIDNEILKLKDKPRNLIEYKTLADGRMQLIFNGKPSYIRDSQEELQRLITIDEDARDKKILDLKSQKQELKSQSIEKLKPIEAFYEIKVGNILEKLYGKSNIKIITDEYGNTWRELEINPIDNTDNILLQQKEFNTVRLFNDQVSNNIQSKLATLYPEIKVLEINNPITNPKTGKQVLGYAVIEAQEVFVDFINGNTDTLPHEYAHHYIAWYRNTPIVQDAIKKWGSEEKLVQAIGEQVVKQNGEAWNWWKGFVNYIRGVFNKEGIKNALTDAFLSGYALDKYRSYDPGIFNQEQESLHIPISNSVYSINSRIRIINSTLTTNTDPVTKRLLQRRILELETDRMKLVDEAFGNTPEILMQVGNRQLDYAKSIITGSTINTEELQLAKDLISTWVFENSSNLLTLEQQDNPNGDFYKALKILSNKALDLELIASKTTKLYIENLTNEILGQHRKDLDVGILPTQNGIKSLLLSGSFSDSDLVKVLDFILKNAKDSQIGYRNEMFERIDTMFNSINNDKALMNVIGKNYELFMQKDDKGELTGNMVQMYSHYWQTEDSRFSARLRSLAERRDKGEITNTAYKELISKAFAHQKTKSIMIDYRLLYKGSNNKASLPGYTFTPESYRKYLIEEYGEALANDLIAQAEYKFSKFSKEREDEKANINSDDSIVDKVAALDKWEEKYNPIRVLDYMYGNVRNEQEYARSMDYIIIAPRKYMPNKNGIKVETEYFDKSFEKIMNNTKLMNFYREYTATMEALVNMLPLQTQKRIPSNFLAKVHKEGLEKAMQKGIIGGTASLITDYIGLYSSEEFAELNDIQESKYGITDSNSGEVRKPIPVRGTGRFNKEHHTTDLKKMIRDFALTAINHEYMNNVRAKAELLNDFIQNAQTLNVDPNTGKNIKGAGGKLTASKVINKDVKEQAKFIMEALTYDERTNKATADKEVTFSEKDRIIETLTLGKIKAPSLLDGHTDIIEQIKKETTGKDFSFPANIRKAQLAKEIEILRNEMDDKLEQDLHAARGDEESQRSIQKMYDENMARLEVKYRSLGGRNLVYANFGEFLIKFTQAKGMALNVTSGISNLLFGVAAVLNHANGRVEYTNRTLARAMQLLLKSGLKSNSKYYNIIKNMDLMFETVDSRYDKGYRSGKYNPVKNFDLFFIQSKTEYVNQSLSAIATLDNTIIKDKNGKDITIYELMNEAGKPNLELLAEEDRAKWTSIVKPGEINEYTKLRNKIVQMNTYLHGNYDPSSPILIKKSIFGRMAMMFRSWIPMGFYSRFADERYDAHMGRNTKGRWRTYYELGLYDSVNTLLKQLTYRSKENTFGDMSAVDIENMRKNLSELGIVLALNGLWFALKSLGDDDEEKTITDYIRITFMNQIYRAEQDVWFYINPITFYEIIKDPLPVTKTVTDLLRAIENSYKHITDEDYEGHPWYVAWAKVFPVLNQIPKTAYLAENDMNK